MTTSLYSLPDFLKVVAHETRWRILTHLASSEYSVAELAIALREAPSLVADHVQMLHDRGLITQRRSLSDEHIRYYSFNLEAVRTQYFQIGEALHPALFSSSQFPRVPVTPSPKPARVLFLCTENSARSQMAEALLTSISHGTVEAVSAGSHPTQIHPYALRALAAVGIDISQKKSRHVDQFVDQTFDRVITLCDRMHESCPHVLDDTNALHWGFPDPALVQGTEEQRYRAFEQTGLQLATRIRYLLIFLEREKRWKEGEHESRVSKQKEKQ